MAPVQSVGTNWWAREATLKYAISSKCPPCVACSLQVPHTLIAHWIDVQPDELGSLTAYKDQAFKPFMHHIQYELPYYNRSHGADHILYVYHMQRQQAARLFLCMSQAAISIVALC